jgi:transposase
MSLHRNVFGVDVAGDWIDVFEASNSVSTRILSDGIEAFAASLPADAFVVFEATGGHERRLMEALEVAGAAYARLNPRHVREFARATGRLAKTDRVDARVLAEMGRALDLRPTVRVDGGRLRLAELVARRDAIVAAITAETNRLGMARDAFVRRDIGRMLGVLRGRRAAIEKEIASHISAHQPLASDAARLRTAPGIGPTIAAVLLARLPELGRLDRRAIASLAGLAPHACDSGHRRGRRHVWGGRAEARRALYIAALVASRYNPVLKAVRDRMQVAGKPTKVAILAIARKLLTILNAMLRDQRDFV